MQYVDATRSGEQESERGNVIEDWDIVRLKQGQCIVSLPDGNPYWFYPTKYPEPKERILIANHATPKIQITGGNS